MSILLSDILGGPEQVDRPFSKMADEICRRKEIYQKDGVNPEDGTINVVFQYPGSLLQPNFVGVRTGSYSKKKRMLVVQVAFPADLLSASDFVKHYLGFLKEALTEGKKYLENKGISFSLEDHIALAEKSVEGLIQAE